MKTLSIGITTFRNRFDDVSAQIKSIRDYDKNIDILLAVTSNYNEKMPATYRKGILSLCSEYDNIYPLMFPGYTGLAKMWNNLIVHSTTSHIFLMNDDISFNNPMALNELRMHIQNKDIFEVNWGFGTFVISKKLSIDMGFFDERFIAYGEEDGDFMRRYEKKFNKKIDKVPIPNINNRIQNRLKHSYDTSMDSVIADGGSKPKINIEVYKKKIKENWEMPNQYPSEKFIIENSHNIGKFTEIKL